MPGLLSKHWFYLGILYGVGSGILDGAINFGLAAAMYARSSQPVEIWAFPNTLAGDLAVTVLIEVVLTWVIAGMIVCHDVRKQKIAPLHSDSLERFRNTSRLNWLLTGHMDLLQPDISPGARLSILGAMCMRGLLLCIPVFILFWPLAVGLLVATVPSSRHFNTWPQPQVIKLLFGGILGLVITPVVAYLALVRMSWKATVANANAGSSSTLRDVYVVRYPSAWTESAADPLPAVGHVRAPSADRGSAGFFLSGAGAGGALAAPASGQLSRAGDSPSHIATQDRDVHGYGFQVAVDGGHADPSSADESVVGVYSNL